MLEDPNHGWFKEQFAFMTRDPAVALRVRAEAVRRAAAAGGGRRSGGGADQRALDRHDGLRRGRGLRADAAPACAAIATLQARSEDTRFVELEIAYYMGWTGHYTADGAQPLHDTVHHDGWQGANPKGFTTNPRVHGLFETQFVDVMKLEGGDFQPKVRRGAGARRSVRRDRRASRRGRPSHRSRSTGSKRRARWPIRRTPRPGRWSSSRRRVARRCCATSPTRPGCAAAKPPDERPGRQPDRAGASALQPADRQRAGASPIARPPVGHWIREAVQRLRLRHVSIA